MCFHQLCHHVRNDGVLWGIRPRQVNQQGGNRVDVLCRRIARICRVKKFESSFPVEFGQIVCVLKYGVFVRWYLHGIYGLHPLDAERILPSGGRRWFGRR
ncbi:unnamed protein product, partial [Nesidiocoris tenuis]